MALGQMEPQTHRMLMLRRRVRLARDSARVVTAPGVGVE
jgi:hypothetical protein